MQSSTRRKHASDPAAIRAQLQNFLQRCRQPALVEAGEAVLRLEQDKFVLEERPAGCTLQAWGESGNIVRRIVGIDGERNGRLTVRTRRFGAREGTLELFDAARSRKSAGRQVDMNRFRESLRRLLQRDFADWKVQRLTAAADLERSLSPQYVRGLLTQGQRALGVIAAPPEASAAACEDILAAGLIWLDLLRSGQRRRVCGGLRIFLPSGRWATTAARLSCLRGSGLRFELFEFDRRGRLARIDESDSGNLTGDLPPCLPPSEPEGETAVRFRRLLEAADGERVPRVDGLISLRVAGIEFARAGRSQISFGLDKQRPLTSESLEEALTLARELRRLRRPAPPDPHNPLYLKHPERWLESQVRRFISQIDPALASAPIYSEAPVALGRSRGVLDLLAADRAGRLTVLELKTAEDLALPLQGLDYWLLVKRHLDRGDFAERGYFPGVALSPAPPRLLLVAPALKFHPTTETLLRYLDPAVPVERIGLNSNWREGLTLVFRAKGSAKLA